jgi:hypothetical protein
VQQQQGAGQEVHRIEQPQQEESAVDCLPLEDEKMKQRELHIYELIERLEVIRKYRLILC